MKKIILPLSIVLSLHSAHAQAVVVRPVYRHPLIMPVYVAPRLISEPIVAVKPVICPLVIAPVVQHPVTIMDPIPVHRGVVVRRRVRYYH